MDTFFVKTKVPSLIFAVTATLEENDAVQELVEMIQARPVTVDMSGYSGFEKVGPLWRSLTTSNSQTATTSADTNESAMGGSVKGLEGWTACFEKA